MSRDWFVAQAEWQHERQAVKNLTALGFDAYCPVVIRDRLGHRAGPLQIEELPFRPYIFVAFDVGNDPWRAVNGTPAVRGLLAMNPEKPRPLPAGYVEQLRENPATVEAMVATTIKFVEGERLRVKLGDRFHAGVYQSRRGDLIGVLMHILGRKRVVLVQPKDIDRLNGKPVPWGSKWPTSQKKTSSSPG